MSASPFPPCPSLCERRPPTEAGCFRTTQRNHWSSRRDLWASAKLLSLSPLRRRRPRRFPRPRSRHLPTKSVVNNNNFLHQTFFTVFFRNLITVFIFTTFVTHYNIVYSCIQSILGLFPENNYSYSLFFYRAATGPRYHQTPFTRSLRTITQKHIQTRPIQPTREYSGGREKSSKTRELLRFTNCFLYADQAKTRTELHQSWCGSGGKQCSTRKTVHNPRKPLQCLG